MMVKYTAPILVCCALLMLSTSVSANEGKIKIQMKDTKGRVVNGTAEARRGNLKRTCNTTAGTCTITGLSPGSWSVSGKSFGGLKDGPYNSTVTVGNVSLVELRVKVSNTPGPTGGTLAPARARPRPNDKPIHHDHSSDPNRGRSLAKGKIKKVVGTVRDKNNKVVNGVVMVRKGTATKGYAKTKDGVYQIHDLKPGTYTFTFQASRTKKRVKKVKVKKDSITVANFAL